LTAAFARPQPSAIVNCVSNNCWSLRRLRGSSGIRETLLPPVELACIVALDVAHVLMQSEHRARVAALSDFG